MNSLAWCSSAPCWFILGKSCYIRNPGQKIAQILETLLHASRTHAETTGTARAACWRDTIIDFILVDGYYTTIQSETERLYI
jgi:hypothetical protein